MLIQPYVENAILHGINHKAERGKLKITASDLFEQSVEHPEASPINAGHSVSEMERKLIMATLDQTSGNRTHASKLLGISLRTLRNKLREYRVEDVSGCEREPDRAMPSREVTV